jgi:hypothetical protein
MIPPFDDKGNLPPGVHIATLAEIEGRFVTNLGRKRLFNALKKVVKIFEKCNCQEIYLNGSFITIADEPNDYDICWEPTGISPTAELKVILEDLEAAKMKYLGDIFVRFPVPPFYFDHVIEWQKDRNGNAKGIIRIELGKMT